VEGGEFTGRPEIGPDALAPAASLDLRGKIWAGDEGEQSSTIEYTHQPPPPTKLDMVLHLTHPNKHEIMQY
jgi:hypothetical protein